MSKVGLISLKTRVHHLKGMGKVLVMGGPTVFGHLGRERALLAILLPPWIDASQHKYWAGQEKCSDVGHVVEAPLECIEREPLSRIHPRQYFQHYGGIPYPHYGFENKPCHAEPMLASF